MHGNERYGVCDDEEGVSMSFGKMNAFIDLVKKEVSVDAEGFKSEKEVTLASVRAYREGRHGSERWANMAAFSEATDLFRFRVIPGVSVTTDLALLCDGDRFEITSVEDVKGRGMYLEVMAKVVKASGAQRNVGSPQSKIALWGKEEQRIE